jgi:hypothetical protein
MSYTKEQRIVNQSKAPTAVNVQGTPISSMGGSPMMLPNHSGIATHPEMISLLDDYARLSGTNVWTGSNEFQGSYVYIDTTLNATDTSTFSGPTEFTYGTSTNYSLYAFGNSTGGSLNWIEFLDGDISFGRIVETFGYFGFLGTSTAFFGCDTSNFALFSAGAGGTFTMATATGATMTATSWTFTGSIIPATDIDMNGTAFYIDADKDSRIQEISDDVVGLYLAGAEEYRFAANRITFNNGAIDTYLDFSTSGQLDIGVNATSELIATASKIRINSELEIDGALNHDGSRAGFYNVTPVSQPSSTGETIGFTAGAGTNVTDASTFTGNVGTTAYRLSDIVKHLKNLGLIAT